MFCSYGHSYSILVGIIQNAESETVQFVEELVLSHIRGNCLILVTLPMSGIYSFRLESHIISLFVYVKDDIENQKAARLARQEDPKGLRTIGNPRYFVAPFSIAYVS